MNNDHTELHRDMGRVEAGLESLEKAMQEGFRRIEERLTKIEADVEALKTTESQRKGAFQLGHWLIGTVSGFIAFLAAYFIK